MSTNRFSDPQLALDSFCDEILVVCPGCGACARVLPLSEKTLPPTTFSPRRLTCARCGHNKEWRGKRIERSADRDARDEYFRQPLWLQASCVGHTLWAYNHRHLQLLEDFVAATLRESSNANHHGLITRLPAWIKAANHRDPILAAIAKMRHREDR